MARTLVFIRTISKYILSNVVSSFLLWSVKSNFEFGTFSITKNNDNSSSVLLLRKGSGSFELEPVLYMVDFTQI